MSAALQQGQSVAVRQTGSPVRIQTQSGAPLVAVTVQSAQQTQQDQQVGIPRLHKKNL